MRKTILYLTYLTLICFCSCKTKTEEGNTTLIGIIESVQDGTKIYIVDQNFYEEGGLLDSTRVKNNEFRFKFSLNEPRMFLIKSESANTTKSLILKKGISKIEIKDNFDNIEFISNLEENLDLIKYRKNKEEIGPIQFIKDNPSKFLSTLILWSERNNLTNSELDEYYKMIPEKWKNTIYGNDIEEIINSTFNPKTNSTFPDFSLKNENENSVNLSDLSNKVALIDFTASWCSPCMAQIPFQKKLYEKFKDKGFEIIHIYLEDREKMLTVRDNKKIPWITVYDSKAFRSDLAKKFRINSIPRLFIINSNRKIIGNEESDYIKYEGMSSFDEKYILMEKELESILK